MVHFFNYGQNPTKDKFADKQDYKAEINDSKIQMNMLIIDSVKGRELILDKLVDYRNGKYPVKQYQR